jgi:hypothetical protein
MLTHVLLYLHALINTIETEMCPFESLLALFIVYSVHHFRNYWSEVVWYMVL